MIDNQFNDYERLPSPSPLKPPNLRGMAKAKVVKARRLRGTVNPSPPMAMDSDPTAVDDSSPGNI